MSTTSLAVLVANVLTPWLVAALVFMFTGRVLARQGCAGPVQAAAVFCATCGLLASATVILIFASGLGGMLDSTYELQWAREALVPLAAGAGTAVAAASLIVMFAFGVCKVRRRCAGCRECGYR